MEENTLDLDSDNLIQVGQASGDGAHTPIDDLDVPPATDDDGGGGDAINENEDEAPLDDDYPDWGRLEDLL
ncbi:hypothetical protein SESBI_00481 [Sesbania bispinosa]|nr:hypothetical protein SESBI_00481 [Sesbania bispinosa]